MRKIVFAAILYSVTLSVSAQTLLKTHKDSLVKAAAKTEVFAPSRPIVGPGKTNLDAPSDAVILFNGKNLNEWVLTKDPKKQADWKVADGILTVNKPSGNIQTKRTFTNYQLHIEWRIPAEFAKIPGNNPDFYKSRVPGDTDVLNTGQVRGNSGIFLASTGSGDAGYELQVLDNYKNSTYVNGQAGSIYKQTPPLVNACKKPGEWQSYDVIWNAPKFNADGSLNTPAHVTVFQNGVLIQNNTEVKGETVWIGEPFYKAHGACPIKLQSHGDKSQPINFKNIWIRNL
ncbi:MAG: DUF1080 domain-containing protein [Sphingobacteriales bacterium]